jgi:hypothetical protein
MTTNNIGRTKLLPLGTKIWCPVSFMHEPGVTFHVNLVRPSFFAFGGFHFVYAVMAPWYSTSKWEATDNPPNGIKYIRCICKSEIPKNWIHFNVVERIRGVRIVEPVIGTDSEATRHFIKYAKLPHSKFLEL